MTDRDVGTMGEHEFASWCASVGLIANRPSHDAGAWDYFVQFGSPVLQEGVQTLDHIEPPRSCWVQVKSTDNKCGQDIALSNWIRMIEPALPFFVLVLNFAGQDHPVDANLVHIDVRFVEKVLKRLRQLGVADVQFLHKHTMSVPWDDNDCLPEPSGKALLAEIKRYLGPSAGEYHAMKKRWCDEAGYERSRFRLTFTTTAPSRESAEDQMMDFALGLRNELPCTVTSIEEVRFSIAAPADDGVFPRDASITLPEPPSIPGTLELSDESGVCRVSHPVRVFHPRIVFPFLPLDRLRFRIAMANVDIILGRRGTPPCFSVAPLSTTTEQRSVAEWARTFRAIRLLTEPGHTLTMALDVLGTHGTWKLSGLQCSPIPAFDVEVMKAALDAATALQSLKLEIDQTVSLVELHYRRRLLAEAAQVLGSKTADVVLQGAVDGEPPDGLVVGHPLTLAIPIGCVLIVVGIAYFGPIQLGDARDGRRDFRVVSPEQRVLFVEKISMVLGESYPAGPWLRRVSDWITAQKMDLLFPTESPEDE